MSGGQALIGAGSRPAAFGARRHIAPIHFARLRSASDVADRRGPGATRTVLIRPDQYRGAGRHHENGPALGRRPETRRLRAAADSGSGRNHFLEDGRYRHDLDLACSRRSFLYVSNLLTLAERAIRSAPFPKCCRCGLVC